MDYKLLSRWFVGLAMDARFLAGVLGSLESKRFFRIDGTLIGAWAGIKRFRPKKGEASNGDDDDASVEGGRAEAQTKGRNAEREFRGEKRANATRASNTDPDVSQFKMARAQAARLCHIAHVLMENRTGKSSMRRSLTPRARPNGRRR